MLKRRTAVAVIAVAMLCGVAASEGPPATASATAARGGARAPAAGQFVWRDLVTPDPNACRAFYGALFGWTFESGEGVDPGYTIIKHAGLPIGGIVPMTRTGADAPIAQWLTYVTVDDVDRAAATFTQSGGKVFRGPLNARKDLRVAVVADAQGAPIGLASRGPKVTIDDTKVPDVHRWLWTEYVAVDADAALKFLGDTIGFGREVTTTQNNFTYYLLTTDRPRAGLFRSPWQRDTSAWLPYVRVEDPVAMATRVTELGGSVVLPPQGSIRNGSVTIVLDPTGAPLALQKFPFETGATP